MFPSVDGSEEPVWIGGPHERLGLGVVLRDVAVMVAGMLWRETDFKLNSGATFTVGVSMIDRIEQSP